MIEQLGHAYRALLVSAKSMAILGNRDLAIQSLSGDLSKATKLEKLAVLMGKAEIHNWDLRDDLALAVFIEIDPLVGDFTEAAEVSVAYNRSAITFALIQVNDFDCVIDRR